MKKTSHTHRHRDSRHGAKQPEVFNPARAALLDSPDRFDYLPPDRIFAHLEAPIRALFPAMNDESCVTLSRSLFSAVHGVVSLGLEEKLILIPLPVLRRQTALIAAAASRGLSHMSLAQLSA